VDVLGYEHILDLKRAGRKRRQLMVCFQQAVDEAH
jgi:hypothetical protein